MLPNHNNEFQKSQKCYKSLGFPSFPWDFCSWGKEPLILWWPMLPTYWGERESKVIPETLENQTVRKNIKMKWWNWIIPAVSHASTNNRSWWKTFTIQFAFISMLSNMVHLHQIWKKALFFISHHLETGNGIACKISTGPNDIGVWSYWIKFWIKVHYEVLW